MAVQVYARLLEIATSPTLHNSGATDGIGIAMRTLASNLLHREHLMRYGIDQATETFESNLSSLRGDVLSSVRTAFIGKLTEEAYHAANIDYGNCALNST
jgi:hypothetical protein